MGIADHGAFSAAAEVLGTVQSNISTRIARLESELGTELVNRATGSLTESGEIVVHRARRILGEIGAIGSDVSELSADIHGKVSLGMIGTAGRWIVPLLLEAQRTNYPHIALRITEGSNSTIEPQLVHGQLDIAVLAWPVLADELSEVDLFSEDLVVIVDREHEIAQSDQSISLAELADYELLLPLGGTPIRREIDEACLEQGVVLHPLIEVDGLRTIASMTFDGHDARRSARDDAVRAPARQIRSGAHSNLRRRRVVLASRRFGFPSAPVRAIQALLLEVVRTTANVPDSVYIPNS